MSIAAWHPAFDSYTMDQSSLLFQYLHSSTNQVDCTMHDPCPPLPSLTLQFVITFIITNVLNLWEWECEAPGSCVYSWVLIGNCMVCETHGHRYWYPHCHGVILRYHVVSPSLHCIVVVVTLSSCCPHHTRVATSSAIGQCVVITVVRVLGHWGIIIIMSPTLLFLQHQVKACGCAYNYDSDIVVSLMVLGHR